MNYRNYGSQMIRLFVVYGIILSALSCKYDKIEVVADSTGYPAEVENILINKCATSGCHNAQSYLSCGKLSFETWDKMFEGGSSGAVAIPFRPDYSTLLFFTNTDTSKGLVLNPRMPVDMPALSASEYDILRNWIEAGAPDKNGVVKFSDNPGRKKLYIANQSVNEVAVLDLNSGLLMRYVHTSVQPGDFLHFVQVSPDNQYWFALLSNGGELKRYRTSDNSFAGSVQIGTKTWHTMTISSDSKRAYIVEMNVPGSVACVNLENMTLIDTWQNFHYPHGCTLNSTDDTLYMTGQNGNFIYKIPVNDHQNFSYVVLDSTGTWSTTPSLNPHDIMFSADHSKYYVTCQSSNEVRVMRTSDDHLLSVISTPTFPVRMSISKTHPYLFVSCLNTSNDSTTVLGRVYCINMNTDAITGSVMTGHQPHGIAVCDEKNLVYVANRNFGHGGPVSHHSGPLGQNGYITAINMNTLQLVDYKCEVAVDPYSVSITK